MIKRFMFIFTIVLHCISSLYSMHQADEYSIEVKIEQETVPYIDAVGKLIIESFKGCPYFYSGTLDMEREYFTSWATRQHSLFVLAKQNNHVVGFICGAPLHTHTKIYQLYKEKFAEAGITAESCFYYSQVIVDKAHQGKHLVTKMFEQADKTVKAWGYTYVSLATEPDNYPRKLEGALETGPIWVRFGYQKHLELLIYATWPTFIDDQGTVKDVENPLVMWTKKFE